MAKAEPQDIPYTTAGLRLQQHTRDAGRVLDKYGRMVVMCKRIGDNDNELADALGSCAVRALLGKETSWPHEPLDICPPKGLKGVACDMMCGNRVPFTCYDTGDKTCSEVASEIQRYLIPAEPAVELEPATDTAAMSWHELRAHAKSIGIDSYGKKRPQLEAEIAERESVAT